MYHDGDTESSPAASSNRQLANVASSTVCRQSCRPLLWLPAHQLRLRHAIGQTVQAVKTCVAA